MKRPTTVDRVTVCRVLATVCRRWSRSPRRWPLGAPYDFARDLAIGEDGALSVAESAARANRVRVQDARAIVRSWASELDAAWPAESPGSHAHALAVAARSSRPRPDLFREAGFEVDLVERVIARMAN